MYKSRAWERGLHGGRELRGHPHGDDVKSVTLEEVIEGLCTDSKEERPHVHAPGSATEPSATLSHSHALPLQLHRTHPAASSSWEILETRKGLQHLKVSENVLTVTRRRISWEITRDLLAS